MICVICLDNYKNKKTLKCQHTFCNLCWEKWSLINSTCPICRTVIKERKSCIYWLRILKKEMIIIFKIIEEFFLIIHPMHCD